ncbi:MAG: hypothetical protein ABII27_02535 [bacterium]
MNIKLAIIKGKEMFFNKSLEKVLSWGRERNLWLNLKDANFSIIVSNHKQIYMFGEVFYYIKEDGNIVYLNEKSSSWLRKLFTVERLEDIIENLEGQYYGIYIDSINKTAKIFSDKYTRYECFYAHSGEDFYLGSDLDFIFQYVKAAYNQKMIAHMFSVYGWYTPKGMTIYSNVKRVKVGEILTLSSKGITSAILKFKPINISEHSDDNLEKYAKFFRESIIARVGNKKHVWVSSSSGWDSSAILGMLVDQFGPSKVSMITGSMKYSKQTDVINKFEMDKIKKIGRFFGLKPKIVDFNFINKNSADYWQKISPYFKSRHIYTNSCFNFAKISDGLNNSRGDSQLIFNGELSDSIHNFGFSQFATFFHTSKSFTEYGDKMNCYLYGPSFFKKVLNGTYEKDKVYVIFKKMLGENNFEEYISNLENRKKSYLFPLFYGSPRVPFAKTYKNQVLTVKGQNAIFNYPFNEYMPEALSFTDKNMYSWFLNLYQHFHSQGSTVTIQRYAMEYNNHKSRQPFNDYRLISLMSSAPESWGRGLDLNNTKFPLKWVLKNKIRFPYEVLQEGPHSYLYDVIEGFTLTAEVLYRSGIANYYKSVLQRRPYREIISDEYVNMNYLDKLTKDYISGKEVKGLDLNNLASLITFCITGWY